jgi:allantoinase
MSLDDQYLQYPHRRHGMDHDRYAWRLSINRPRRVLAQGRKLACMIVVPLEFHRLDPQGKPFRHPGAMQTPYPDLRHYTTRDYGLRVGVFRILKELKAAGLKAVFPMNASLLDRVQPLVAAIRDDGHEIAAYGLDADAIHWGGIDPAVEEQRVTAVRAAFDAAGIPARTWMSPARSQGLRTPDAIRAQGFDICLDWEIDNVPVAFRTDHGPLSCVPLFGELDDRKLLIDQRQGEDEWRTQILEAADMLLAEHERFGAQVLSFTLTPYVTGQPFRIHAVREVMQSLASHPDIWSATATQITEAWS